MSMRRLALAATTLVILTILISSYKPRNPIHDSQLTPHASPLTTYGLPLSDTILFPGEKHFKNIQQLTFGGDNAEAYFSYDGKWIIFQRTNPKEGIMCDEMFIGKVPTKPGEK